MPTRQYSVLILSVSLMAMGEASSQTYPIKPIRIVTSEPGGGNDVIARILGQGISGSMGQPVIVENRGGGGGIITITTVSHAQPDGYTLLFYTSGLWTLPLIQPAPYNPIKDFSPITLAATAPNILAVYPPLPVKSVAELIALAKAKPGALNYGSGPTGASSHLAPELFKAMAGVSMVRIPFKGNGPSLNALIAGEVQVAFANAAGVGPHLKSGRLRALAVTSAQPSALFPELPTVAASGLPGYESVSIQAVFAPANTPAAIVARLNQEFVSVLNQAETKMKILNLAVEPVGSTPAQLAASIKSDMTNLGKLIRDAGIQAD